MDSASEASPTRHKHHSLEYQRLFLRTHWMRRWMLIIGEGIAVISGLAYFVPGLPQLLHDIAIPVAVLSGATALLSVALYDKLDPTVVRACFLTNEAYSLLQEKKLIHGDVMYMMADDFPTLRRPGKEK